MLWLLVVLQEPMEDDKERKVLGETEVDNHVKSFENERRLFCILFGKVINIELSFQKRFTKKLVSIKFPVLVPVLGGQNLIVAMAVQGRGARFFFITLHTYKNLLQGKVSLSLQISWIHSKTLFMVVEPVFFPGLTPNSLQITS